MATNAIYGMRYPAETKARAFAMLAAGSTLLQTEAATGVSRTTLKRWMREAGCAGLPPGSLPSRPEITTERAIALCREHGSISAAARAIGMHPSTLSRRANSETFVQ